MFCIWKSFPFVIVLKDLILGSVLLVFGLGVYNLFRKTLSPLQSVIGK